MSLKDNYLELVKKFGGPYSLEKKGIKRGLIDSILKGSDILSSNLKKVADVLGVTMDELFGKKPPKKTKQGDPEEEKYIKMVKALIRAEDVKIKNFIRRDIEIFYERLILEQGIAHPQKKIKPPKKLEDDFTEEEMEYIQQLLGILRSDKKETFDALKQNIRVFYHSIYKGKEEG